MDSSPSSAAAAPVLRTRRILSRSVLCCSDRRVSPNVVRLSAAMATIPFFLVTAMVVMRSNNPAETSQNTPPHVGQKLREKSVETGARGAVDDPVIIRKRQGHDEPRLEFPAVPHRLHHRLGDPEDGHFGRVDDGREAGAADAAEA